MRTVVIGASSGLGRCIATGLAKRGDHVAVLARRYEMLVEAAKEAGPGTLAIACDVTDRDSCTRALAEAADGLGGVDGIVYAPAVGTLARLVDTDADTWRRILGTNVIGAANAAAAAIPHLETSQGVMAFLSSWSASLTPPWPGLGAYIVSKAGLDKLVEALRVEYPHVGFTRVIVGDCGGGEGDSVSQFANGWDPDLALELLNQWTKYMTGTLLPVERLVDVVHTVLSTGAQTSVPSVAVLPRAAP